MITSISRKLQVMSYEHVSCILDLTGIREIILHVSSYLISRFLPDNLTVGFRVVLQFQMEKELLLVRLKSWSTGERGQPSPFSLADLIHRVNDEREDKSDTSVVLLSR